jgi:HK97 gp10 family phage protein
MATATYTVLLGGTGSFTIHGAEQIKERLRGLEPKLLRREARRAVRAGATVWRDAAAVYAREFDDPKTPNSIARSIAIRESGRGGRAEGGIHFRVGVLGGAKKKFVGPLEPRGLRKRKRRPRDRTETYYWRFLEFGTRKMRAQPFLRPAYNQNIETATEAVAVVLSGGIDRVVP